MARIGKPFRTFFETEILALGLGILTGFLTWWGWFSEWALMDPDWSVKQNALTHLFRGTHPSPFFPAGGADAWYCSLYIGFLEWELPFVALIIIVLLSLRKRLEKDTHAGRILIWPALFLILLWLPEPLNIASVPIVLVLPLPAFLFSILLLGISVRRTPLHSVPSYFETLILIPCFCGIAYLLNTQVYPFYFYDFLVGPPPANILPAIPFVLLTGIAYAAPLALRLFRWRCPPLSRHGPLPREIYWTVLGIPATLSIMSSLAFVLFTQARPDFHRGGNAAWINLFYYIQTCCLNMIVVLFDFRLSGLERLAVAADEADT